MEQHETIQSANLMPYRAFVYSKLETKPHMEYGQNAEEILNNLRRKNIGKPEGLAYETCNIGRYDSEMKTYTDYQKYEINTGKNITSIYLEMPNGLTSQEFRATLNFFKENGARFNSFKKKWYIHEDMVEKFEGYLETKEDNHTEKGEQTQQDKSAESEHNEPLPDGKKIYLNIPKSMDSDTFKSTINYFKEHGARFEAGLKKWYIREDMTEDFKEYTDFPENQIPEVRTEEMNLPVEHKKSMVNYINNIKNMYQVELITGEKIVVDANEITQRKGVDTIEKLKAVDIMDVLEEKISEHMDNTTFIEDEKYNITINGMVENSCSVYIKDGNFTVELYGDQFGIYFPMLNENKVIQIVNQYIESQNRQIETAEPILKEGKTVTVGIPVYEGQYISGIDKLQGRIVEVSGDRLCLQEENGTMKDVNIRQMYSEKQISVMERAMEKGLSHEQLELIGHPDLNPAQMDVLYWSIRDGMALGHVAMYASPNISAWKMDTYRYGMGKNLPYNTVKDILDAPGGSTWEEARNKVYKTTKEVRNNIIKELKEHNFRPEKQLVEKVERLNLMTGKIQNVRNLTISIEKGSDLFEGYSNEVRGISKEIAGEIKNQNMQRMKMQEVPQMDLCR